MPILRSWWQFIY